MQLNARFAHFPLSFLNYLSTSCITIFPLSCVDLDHLFIIHIPFYYPSSSLHLGVSATSWFWSIGTNNFCLLILSYERFTVWTSLLPTSFSLPVHHLPMGFSYTRSYVIFNSCVR